MKNLLMVSLIYTMSYTAIASEDIYYIESIISGERVAENFIADFETQLINILKINNIIDVKEFKDIRKIKDASELKQAKAININVQRAASGLSFKIKAINVENGAKYFTKSMIIDYQYINNTGHCAKLVADQLELLSKRSFIVVDIVDGFYVINGGRNKSIQIGSTFIAHLPDTKIETGTFTAKKISLTNTFLKPVSSDSYADLGFIMKLSSENMITMDGTCDDLFIPEVSGITDFLNIKISTIPSGAHVFINGCKMEKQTPASIARLVSRNLHIEIVKEGYSNYNFSFQPESKQWYYYNINLEPEMKSSFINVRSKPSGARVYIDGIYTQYTTPVKGVDLSSGNHKISVQLFGFDPYAKFFYIGLGEKKDYDFNLSRDSHSRQGKHSMSSNARHGIETALNYYVTDNFTKSIETLERAALIDPDEGIIFYWLGVLNWIESHNMSNYKKCLDIAQEKGVVFGGITPHPNDVSLDKIKSLIQGVIKK